MLIIIMIYLQIKNNNYNNGLLTVIKNFKNNIDLVTTI